MDGLIMEVYMCIIKKEIEEIGLPCSGLAGKKECEKCSCYKESKAKAALKERREANETD